MEQHAAAYWRTHDLLLRHLRRLHPTVTPQLGPSDTRLISLHDQVGLRLDDTGAALYLWPLRPDTASRRRQAQLFLQLRPWADRRDVYLIVTPEAPA